MRWSLVLLLAACQTTSTAGEKTPDGCAGDRPPNVVLLFADDLGHECLGVNGGTSYSTPRLDRMAAEGIRFRDAHATPLCTPSRAELLTGRHGFRNYERFGYLDPSERTLGTMFSEAGYATCVVGKWQLSYGVDEPRRPAAFGFDTWCLWNTVEDRGPRYADPRLDIDGELHDFPGAFGPDLCCEHGLRFVAANRERPFFLHYPMILPHSPFVRTPGSPEGERTKEELFGDMVAHMDLIVGRVLDGLEELGLAENTLVLFVGDNGTHRAITSGWRGGEVRGGKSHLRAAGTHVPMIVRWPGTAEPAVLDDLVTLVDFAPTLAELCGLDLGAAAGEDGWSFAPRLRGEPGDPREWIFWHYDPRWNVPGRPGRAVYDGRFKLHHDGELFDVLADRDERAPLPADAEPAVRARLGAVLDAMPAWDPPAKARR